MSRDLLPFAGSSCTLHLAFYNLAFETTLRSYPLHSEAFKIQHEILADSLPRDRFWAPANIGPYSQSVRAGGLLWMAGQIGLDPPTMMMVHRFAFFQDDLSDDQSTVVRRADQCEPPNQPYHITLIPLRSTQLMRKSGSLYGRHGM